MEVITKNVKGLSDGPRPRQFNEYATMLYNIHNAYEMNNNVDRCI